MLVAAASQDAFHPWPADRPDWAEAVWFGTWIPESAITVYVYHWFRPVLGIYGGGCIIWDAGSSLPWDAAVFQYDVNRPIREPLDLRDLKLDNGASIASVREGLDYAVSFHSARAHVELRFEGLGPADLTEAHGTEAFFSGHLDQPGRYTGFVEIEGRRHPVDAFGIRDRSWGPRVIGDDIRLGYCHGEGPDVAFLAFSQPKDGDELVIKGYLSLGGVRKALKGGRRRVEMADRRLVRMEIALEDVDGRRFEATGRPLNAFEYMPYPNLLSRHYLLEWSAGQSIIYGEEQDLWSLPLWRDHLRRGTRP
jgi:hypothetical protein